MDYYNLLQIYRNMEKMVMDNKNKITCEKKNEVTIDDYMKQILENEQKNKDNTHYRMNYDAVRLFQVQRMSDENYKILNELKETYNTFYSNK